MDIKIKQFMFHWWFGLILLGSSLRKMPNAVLLQCDSLVPFVEFIFSVVLFGAMKILTQRSSDTEIEILLPVTYALFAYCTMILVMPYNKQIGVFLDMKAGKVIHLLNKCSLEIYFVQFTWISVLKEIAFPLNLVLSIIISGWFLQINNDRLCSRIMNRLEI